MVDGYFAHFVAPEELPPMAKHVIFVLDVSGSMDGKKMTQLQNAMKTILAELRAIDFFSIIKFSDNITEWRKGATAVDENSIREASRFVSELQASGGTNIHAGLMAGLSKVKPLDTKDEVQSMIIFLTDGKYSIHYHERLRLLSIPSCYYVSTYIFLRTGFEFVRFYYEMGKKLETTSRRKAHKRKHGTVKRCTNRHYSDMGVVNITTF